MDNTDAGFGELATLFERLGVLRVGIEGSGSFGRAVAVHLALLTDELTSEVTNREGWAVVEVPTLMTARERRAQIGKGKTDSVDSLAIARITARDPGLAPVRLTVDQPRTYARCWTTAATSSSNAPHWPTARTPS